MSRDFIFQNTHTYTDTRTLRTVILIKAYEYVRFQTLTFTVKFEHCNYTHG